jgi:hypothetical protein
MTSTIIGATLLSKSGSGCFLAVKEKNYVLPHNRMKLILVSLWGAETKNQWARDDPAFVVICSFLLAVAASAFCAA